MAYQLPSDSNDEIDITKLEWDELPPHIKDKLESTFGFSGGLNVIDAAKKSPTLLNSLKKLLSKEPPKVEPKHSIEVIDPEKLQKAKDLGIIKGKGFEMKPSSTGKELVPSQPKLDDTVVISDDVTKVEPKLDDTVVIRDVTPDVKSDIKYPSESTLPLSKIPGKVELKSEFPYKKLLKYLTPVGLTGSALYSLKDKEPIMSEMSEQQAQSLDKRIIPDVLPELKSEQDVQPVVQDVQKEEIPEKRFVSSIPEQKEDVEISKENEDDQLLIDLGESKYKQDKDQLEKALKSRDDIILLNQLAKAGQLLGGGISGTVKGGVVQKPDTSILDENIRLADRPVKDYFLKKEQEKADPNSELSKAYRSYLGKLGVKVEGDMSAEVGERLTPLAFKTFEAKEIREFRNQQAKENREFQKEKLQEDAKNREMLYKLKLEEAKQLKEEKRNIDKLNKDNEFALRVTPKIQNEQYKNLAQIRLSSKLVEDAVNNPSPQKDTGIIYSFIKILDPGSVVREGEIQFTKEARSIPTQLRGTLNKAYQGQILTPQERKNILDFSRVTLHNAYKEWKASAEPFIKQAEARKIPLELIIPADIPDVKEIKTDKKIVKKLYSQSRNQTKIIYSDGSEEILDGKK